MDPRTNPYAPGAGVQPPELAGRGELLEKADIALTRIMAGKPARSLILYGLRGVGKTVLLNRIRREADAKGIATIWIEAPERRSLPSLLIPAIRAVLLRLDRMAAAKSRIADAMGTLASFAKAMRVKYGDIDVAIDIGAIAGQGDSGVLDNDLTDLFRAVGLAAQGRDTAVVLLIDEFQYVAEEQLAAMIVALHAVSQDHLPVALMAAGLPQLVGNMGRAKSYAERLFEFSSIDRLDKSAAQAALEIPARSGKMTFAAAALDEILRQTDRYPYFLQEWGKHAWNIAAASPITVENARSATAEALTELDASFFRVRLDRLTPMEKRYLRAMAQLGPGPHRSGDIAETLGKKVTATAPVRNSLISKGMIYSPAHGDTAFTVPLFDGFMKRAIPNLG